MIRRSPKLLGVAAVLAVAAIGVFAGSSIGGGSAEPATSIDVTGSAARTVDPSELERVSARKLGTVGPRASKKSAKLSYFITAETFTVAPGGSDLREIRCPVKQQPATGGVFAPAPGLAITNSSRTNPRGTTASGAWYEEVTNFTSVALDWRAHLTCVGK